MSEFLSEHRAHLADNPPIALTVERRDTERAIRLWQRKAAESSHPPPLTEFDLEGIRSGYRFIISGGDPRSSVFLVYGSRLANLLHLPEKPVHRWPFIEQIPERYQSIFVEGIDEALVQTAPARYSGAVLRDGQVELYRAAFMPLRLNARSAYALIFGSFNNRTVPQDALDRNRALLDQYLPH